MKQPKPPALIFILLAILFCLPGIAAYWVFLHPEWLTAAKTNKGKLLDPPYQLSNMDDRNKWHLYYWYPGQCDEKCLSNLDRLARVRLALGRKLYEVDLQWLRANNSDPVDAKLRSELAQQDIQLKVLSSKDSEYLLANSNNNWVYIANPDDFLILKYTNIEQSMDIYKDLKHLLSIPVPKGERHA